MSRANSVFLAKVFEKCRRTDDLWAAVCSFTGSKEEFSPEERSLYSGAYKAYCSERKMNIRNCNEIEKFEEKEGKQDLTPLKEFRNKLNAQIRDASKLCLSVVDKFYKGAPTPEADVTKDKLLGDVYKFIYDVEAGEERKKAAQSAHDCYESAHKKSAKLKTTHPVRLGVALAFSVFFDGVFRDTVSACQIAKKAFDEGTKDLDERDKEFFQDSSALLGMLKENLQFWTSELEKNVQ